MMKKYSAWNALQNYSGTPRRSSLLLLVLVAFCLQGCFGTGGSSSNTPSSKTITTNANGQQVGVNQAQNLFKGKIYFTIDHNLWVIDPSGNSREILKQGNIYDPAISPNGKWIAYIARYKNYSNLAYISINGGPPHVLGNGNGKFYNDGGFVHNSFQWYAQPAWSADGSHLMFLSDLQKNYQWAALGPPFNQAAFLDLQVFSVPFDSQGANPQAIAYASFGDGGDRDPSYRPRYPNEIVYTHYAYDAATETQQVIQIFLEDSTQIPDHPGVYHPGAPGGEYDPGIAITSSKDEDLEPAFSPDGNAIAFVKREASGTMGIYVMHVPNGVTTTPNDPTTEQKALIPYKAASHILSGQFVSQPVWSPDGKQIAYISYDNSTFDLWLANINYNAQTGVYSMKGSPVQLTTGGIDGESRPFWTA
jgi:WD40 repeat protein